MVIDAVKVATQEKVYVVGMGEIVVSKLPNVVLTCIGLGSCVAVCAYDEIAKAGGMVHVVLPWTTGIVSNRAKYAATAVPLLIDEVVKIGGRRAQLSVKIVGGAQIISLQGLKDTFSTGEKNVTQIMTEIEKAKIKLAASDIGGNMGRTVRMYLDTGRITIKTISGPIKEL